MSSDECNDLEASNTSLQWCTQYFVSDFSCKIAAAARDFKEQAYQNYLDNVKHVKKNFKFL